MAPHQELVQGWEMFGADRWEIIPYLPSGKRGMYVVLSPTLFNIVVDSLPRTMEAVVLGFYVNNLYGGS